MTDDPQRLFEASKASLRQQTFMFLLGEYERGALSARGFWGNVQSQILAAQQTALLDRVEKEVIPILPAIRPIEEDPWTRGVEGLREAQSEALSKLREEL